MDNIGLFFFFLSHPLIFPVKPPIENGLNEVAILSHIEHAP
jgi:hypothetical protein